MDRSLETLNAVDLVPYRTLIQEGIVPMVMVTQGERYVGVLPRQNLDELVKIAHALEKNAASQ